MGHFIFLRNTVNTPKHIASPPGSHTIDIVDQYDLGPVALSGAHGLLLSQHLDETHLCEHSNLLDTYLSQGGAIALNGPVAQPVLTPPGPYTPLPARKAKDWVVEIAEPHSIARGVRADDLTYRRGVIGFWARGYFEKPPGAIAITRFAASRHAADWVWKRPEGGKIFVHPGNDIWGYAGDNTTAKPLFGQVVDWFAEVRT